MVDIKRESGGSRHRHAVRAAWVGGSVVAAVLGFCHLKPPAPRVSEESLYIDTVRAGAMVIEMRGTGTLVAEDTHWISAATDGRVERILLQPGAVVAPETLVIDLSNSAVVQAASDAELQVRAAEAELRSRRVQIQSQILAQEAVVAAARVEHEDARGRARADAELAREGLTSALTMQSSRGREQQLAVRAAVEQKRFELARQSEHADLAAAGSRLDQLRATSALKREQRQALQVKAGHGGVLQQIAVEMGARVVAGANLARIAAPESLMAVIQISQLDASQIAIGQPVRIDTHEGIVSGSVSRIDPAVKNGSVAIDVRLPRQLPRGARPDLTVDAAVEIDRVDNALRVSRPVQAAAQTSIALFRISKDGRQASRVPVRIGRASYNAIEIVSGLQPGDRVILSDTSAFEKFDQITITR